MKYLKKTITRNSN